MAKCQAPSMFNVSAVKRYKMANDRLCYFTLVMGVGNKAANDWRGVGRPQVAMHSQLPHFLVEERFCRLGFTVYINVSITP